MHYLSSHSRRWAAVLALLPLAVATVACRRSPPPHAAERAAIAWATDDAAECNGQRIARAQVKELLLLPAGSTPSPLAWQQAVDVAIDASVTWAALTPAQRERVQVQLEQEQARLVALQGTPANWQANLRQHGQTAAGWRLALRTDLALDELNRAAVDAPLDPSAVTERYEKRKGRYLQGETVLLTELALPAQVGEVAAAQVMEQALARLQRGEPFAQVAQDLSRVPSRMQGGDRGWTPASNLDPQLAEAVRNLQPGDHTAVVHTQFGWHLLQLRDRRPEQQLPLDQARPLVERHLRDERAFVLRRQKLAELRRAARVQHAPATIAN